MRQARDSGAVLVITSMLLMGCSGPAWNEGDRYLQPGQYREFALTRAEFDGDTVRIRFDGLGRVPRDMQIRITKVPKNCSIHTSYPVWTKGTWGFGIEIYGV